jgi:uncharacterized membrane protein
MNNMPELNNSEKETQRIEAFSDGVFAIAITLLVLQLHVPKAEELGSSTLLAVLVQDWRSHAALIISFLTILIMWFNHHKLFNFIHRTDHVFPYLNGLLLLTIAIVPWPTALVAEYWGNPQEETAAMIYCSLSIVMSVSFNILWRYATNKGRLLGRNVNMEEVARITNHYRFGPLMYVVALVLAYWRASAGIAMCLALAIFFAFTGAIDTGKFKSS